MAPSAAPQQHEHDQQRPDQVELLLDGERPQVAEQLGPSRRSIRRVARNSQLLLKVTAPSTCCRCRRARRRRVAPPCSNQQQHDERRAAAAGPAGARSAPSAMRPVAACSRSSSDGDQESADDEEQVDADVTADQGAGAQVEDDHQGTAIARTPSRPGTRNGARRGVRSPQAFGHGVSPGLRWYRAIPWTSLDSARGAASPIRGASASTSPTTAPTFAGWAKQPGLRTVQGGSRRRSPPSSAAAATRAGSSSPGARTSACTRPGRSRTSTSPPRSSPHRPARPRRRRRPIAGPRRSRRAQRRRRARLRRAGDARRSAPAGFDARFSALWRRYEYRIADADAGTIRAAARTRSGSGRPRRGRDGDAARRLSDCTTSRLLPAARRRHDHPHAAGVLLGPRRRRRARRPGAGRRVLPQHGARARRRVRRGGGAAARGGAVAELRDAAQRTSEFKVVPAKGLTLTEVGYPPDESSAPAPSRPAPDARFGTKSQHDGLTYGGCPHRAGSIRALHRQGCTHRPGTLTGVGFTNTSTRKQSST